MATAGTALVQMARPIQSSDCLASRKIPEHEAESAIRKAIMHSYFRESRIAQFTTKKCQPSLPKYRSTVVSHSETYLETRAFAIRRRRSARRGSILIFNLVSNIVLASHRRRTMLLYDRFFPPGYKRNQKGQIAQSLRRLFHNKDWLDAHTSEG